MSPDRQSRWRRLVVTLFLVALIAHPAVHAGQGPLLSSPVVSVADAADAGATAPHVTCDLCKVRGHIVVEVSGPIAALTPPGEIPLSEPLTFPATAIRGVSSSRAPPNLLFS
jgi:hypothetical protein